MIDKKTLKSLREIFKRSSIRFSKRIEIINFFLTHKNNTVPEICKSLNVSRQIVNMTLDRYFELLQTEKTKIMKNQDQTNVICSPQRVNVFDAKGKLIGQDYQRDNGDWMHKWIDPKTGTFERGSWRGRCKGEDMQNWSYEDCI